jgi:signal transduction histidine kinase
MLMMNHTGSTSRRVPFFSTVTFRLSAGYLLKIVLIIAVLVGISYGPVTRLNRNAGDKQLETQLSQDAEQLISVSQLFLLEHQGPLGGKLSLPENEIVLLLDEHGNLVDGRGPLTLQASDLLRHVGKNESLYFNLRLPLRSRSTDGPVWVNYRVLVKPVFRQNTRIGVLMVGLPRRPAVPASFWLMRGLLVLLIAAVGGFFMARNSMNPARMIVETARAIQATDLRRRLNWKRKDEFGELANTFDDMLARLEAAFKQQAQFTADASHELRTPLTVISLEINRALTQHTEPLEYRQTLDIIQTENEHMISIVNGLLLLARADSGPQMEYRESVDLSDVALTCVERLLPLAKEKNVQISTGELPELMVAGDPQQLGRMVTNILDNAIKYTSDVGERVHIELTSENGLWAVLRITDDGPGIGEEHLDYLFDRFYRVDKARTQYDDVGARMTPGGSGLGLAIVKWIVQSHGGRISVASQAGDGCRFEVRIPLFGKRMMQAAVPD